MNIVGSTRAAPSAALLLIAAACATVVPVRLPVTAGSD